MAGRRKTDTEEHWFDMFWNYVPAQQADIGPSTCRVKEHADNIPELDPTDEEIKAASESHDRMWQAVCDFKEVHPGCWIAKGRLISDFVNRKRKQEEENK